MFKKIIMITAILVSLVPVSGAALIVEQDSIVIEGGTYDQITLDGRKYVTLRSVTVRNTIGTNDYAGIKMTGSKYIDIYRCEVDGGAGGGRGTCGAIKLDGASRVVVRDCKLYNCNDDGFRIYTATYGTFYDNEIYHLLGCGTDGGCSSCNNGHSDGFQIMASIQMDVQRNLIYDIRGNAPFMLHDKNRFVYIYNNIFYGPSVGLVCYLFETEDLKFYNNVVWGTKQGGYGALSLGPGLYRFEMYNNILLNVNTSHLGYAYDAAEHTGDYNLYGETVTGSWPRGSHAVIAGDPGFARIPPINQSQITGSVTSGDFHLKSTSPAIDKGTTGTFVPGIDFYSKARSGTPDIGPIEYGNTTKKARVWFTAANREGAGPLAVTFTNSSPADFTGFAWDFGDGGTATDKNPSHTYIAAGRHTVKLIGTGAGGLADTLQVRFYVVVTSGSGIVGRKTPGSILNGLCLFPDPMTYTTDFYFPSGDGFRITILNSRGAVVRSLTSRHWDGTDDYGRRVKPGMYLYSVTMDGATAQGKIVKLR